MGFNSAFKGLICLANICSTVRPAMFLAIQLANFTALKTNIFFLAYDAVYTGRWVLS